jgi:hypothetical protein
MEKVEVEIYSETVNSPVMRFPGRAFPGVLIQGDSLSILYGLAEAIYQQCKSIGIPEGNIDDAPDTIADTAHELVNLLSGYLLNYEIVLKQHNIRLPYNGPRLLDKNEQVNPENNPD